MEALSHLYPLYKDGYGLTVTEIKDFMFSLEQLVMILLKEVDFKIGEKWSDDYDVK